MPGLCGVCVKATASYTCPRCQLNYCSLACYKGHSTRCTESFYEDQVRVELQSHRATEEERKKLERVVAELSNLGVASPEEEEEEEELEAEEKAEERLMALVAKAERGELNFEDLTEEEARCFHSELKRGVLGQSLTAWEPWWVNASIVSLDLDSLDDDDTPPAPSTTTLPTPSASSRAPKPAHLCCTPGREANPAVAFTVLEAMYAYAHTMRAFNGDWEWDSLQAASHLLHLASSICSKKSYESLGECLHATLAAAARLPGGGFGVPLDDLCLDDLLKMVLRRGDTGERAISEVRGLLTHAREAVVNRPDASSKVIGKLDRGLKKLEFLISYAVHHEDILSLEPQIRAVKTMREGEASLREKQDKEKVQDGVVIPLTKS